jgi:hypothetical protein
MHFIYADESGDTGLSPGGSDHFVLSGVVIHESNWNKVFQAIVEFRRNMHAKYRVPQRIEFHGTEIVTGKGDFHHTQYGLTTAERFELYRDVVGFLASQSDSIHLLNIFIHKTRIIKRDLDLFEFAWTMFIQRFHNCIAEKGCLHRSNEYGVLMTDKTQDDKLRKLLRKMRAINIVPSKIGLSSRNLLANTILDDPIARDSRHSYLIQMADMVAYALARRFYTKPKLAPWGFENYFNILNPALLTLASTDDPQGIYHWPK